MQSARLVNDLASAISAVAPQPHGSDHHISRADRFIHAITLGLESEYITGLPYLTEAIQLMLEETVCSSDAIDEVFQAICWFVHGWYAELKSDGVLRPLTACATQCLHLCDGEVPSLTKFAETLDPVVAAKYCSRLDVFLRIMDESVTKCGWANEIVGRWTQYSNVDHSLTVIDMLFRIRYTSLVHDFYRSDVAREIAFSNATIVSHLLHSKQAMQTRFGADVANEISLLLS